MIFTDGEDGGITDDVDIISLHFASDSDHVFFKIITQSNVDLADSTFGILINDISNSAQVHEVACASYRTGGGSERGYTYLWDSGEWNPADTGSDRTPNVRINTGFSGIELACEKDDLGFTFDETSPDGDKILAVSSDSGRTLFGAAWIEENTPSTNIDDITDSTSVPEFSTLLIPIASVMLIVGNRIKNKNE